MDAQVNYTVGMPVGLRDGLSPPIDATESPIDIPNEVLEQGASQ